MSEDLVTDTEVHTDLDPLEAPDWSVEVSLVDKPECLLAKAPRPLLRHQDGEDVDRGAAGGERGERRDGSGPGPAGPDLVQLG